jgi:hypothetical protein
MPIPKSVGTRAGNDLHAGAPGAHFVHFYESEEALTPVVAGFIADGLSAGGHAVLIASGPRLRGFAGALQSMGVRPDDDGSLPRVVLLDAHETLERLLVGGMPSEELFEAHVAAFLSDRAKRSRVRMRAYGEMVDILWKRGQKAAAFRLEEMWNDLGGRLHFSLLCAYAKDSFKQFVDEEGLAAVCKLHTGVTPAGDTFHAPE